MIQCTEVPLGYGVWVEGVVISHDEDTGNVTIQTDDGTKYQRCET
jgi:hypothetical protein